MAVNYDRLANELFFGKKVDLPQLFEAHNVEYRKNKTLADVINARRKALKLGIGITEHELNFFQLYLKDVLKNKKVIK